MFSFLQKKAEIQIQLHSSEAQIGGKISGKILVTPIEEFVSNSLEIRLIPLTVAKTFDCPPLIKRAIQGSSQFSANGIVEIPFEIDFANTSELDDWYEFEVRWSWSDGSYGYDTFMKEIHEKWAIEAYFDIPGFDVSTKAEIQVK